MDGLTFKAKEVSDSGSQAGVADCAETPLVKCLHSELHISFRHKEYPVHFDV
jgi:hypothetical protein